MKNSDFHGGGCMDFNECEWDNYGSGQINFISLTWIVGP